MSATKYEDHDPGSAVRGCVIGVLISGLMVAVAALAAYGAYEFITHVY